MPEQAALFESRHTYTISRTRVKEIKPSFRYPNSSSYKGM